MGMKPSIGLLMRRAKSHRGGATDPQTTARAGIRIPCCGFVENSGWCRISLRSIFKPSVFCETLPNMDSTLKPNHTQAARQSNEEWRRLYYT